jgi:hypothetical protein
MYKTKKEVTDDKDGSTNENKFNVETATLC